MIGYGGFFGVEIPPFLSLESFGGCGDFDLYPHHEISKIHQVREKSGKNQGILLHEMLGTLIEY